MIVAAALLAICLPSSVDGEISTPLSLAGSMGPALLLLIAIRWNGWQRARVRWLLALAGIILVSTLISPFHYAAWGAGAPYCLASLVLLTDLRPVDATPSVRMDRLLLWVVFWIDCFLLAIGFGILLDSLFATGLIQSHYQSLHDDLYEQMVVWHAKPVTIFGSHSTAAFAYFSLFVLNFKIALNSNVRTAWRLVYLASAAGFLILDWALASNTSVVMIIFASIYLVFSLGKSMRFEWRVLLVASFLVVGGAFVVDWNLGSLLFDSTGGNGFVARYAAGGRLDGTYDYLAKNSLLPIGLSSSPEISLGDNFIAEYILRLSPFGYAIILYLLWSWLRRHLNFQRAIIFFGFFLLADLAYPLLVYSRVAAALPFYVLVWRRLESGDFLDARPRSQTRHGGWSRDPGLAVES